MVLSRIGFHSSRCAREVPHLPGPVRRSTSHSASALPTTVLADHSFPSQLWNWPTFPVSPGRARCQTTTWDLFPLVPFLLAARPALDALHLASLSFPLSCSSYCCEDLLPQSAFQLSWRALLCFRLHFVLLFKWEKISSLLFPGFSLHSFPCLPFSPFPPPPLFLLSNFSSFFFSLLLFRFIFFFFLLSPQLFPHSCKINPLKRCGKQIGRGVIKKKKELYSFYYLF